MEILNSGSFVPLDNREKIDQLIYTARELATEVSRTEGFQNNGQTNHQLGLEMWKGAEYVCRAHEETNIRNLFLSKFLERLREIERERTVQTMPPAAQVPQPLPAPVSVQPPAPQTVPAQPPKDAVQDEYLGVIPADPPADSNRPSYADECVPEAEAEIAAMNNGSGPSDFINPPAESSSEPQISEPSEDLSAGVSAELDNSDSTGPPTSEQSAASEVTEEVVSEAKNSAGSNSIESIVLAEKEPYNLDACTLTVVIQLLPESSGLRKCVISLRTHDFAPIVAVSEAGAGVIIPHISAVLSEALARYRIDLPAKAAEKLKKEKPIAKKQSKPGSKAGKATIAQSKAATNSESATTAPTPNAETDQSQRGLFTS